MSLLGNFKVSPRVRTRFPKSKYAGYWVLTYQDHFQCHKMEGSSKILQHWNCVIITDQMITFQMESNFRAMCALNWIVCRLIHFPLARVARELRYSWDILAIHLRYTCDTLARIGAGCVTCVHLRATCASLEIHLRDTLASICAQNKKLQATCGTLADMLWGVEYVIGLWKLYCSGRNHWSAWPLVCMMWVSTYCFSTSFGPTMEILGSLERYWQVESIFHKFGA